MFKKPSYEKYVELHYDLLLRTDVYKLFIIILLLLIKIQSIPYKLINLTLLKQYLQNSPSFRFSIYEFFPIFQTKLLGLLQMAA